MRNVRSDNGKEFSCAGLRQWLRQKGIRYEFTSPYSPDNNGKAERINRTLMGIARPLLQNIGSVCVRLLNHLWENSIATACYLRNRSYTNACHELDSTPYQAMTGAIVTDLRVFGSEAYSHIPKVHRHEKISPRAQRGLYVGYYRGNSYKIFLPETNQPIVSRDVRFVEPICSAGKLKCTSFEPVLNKAKQGANNPGKASQEDLELEHDMLDDVIPDPGVKDNPHVRSTNELDIEEYTEAIAEESYSEIDLDTLTHHPPHKRSGRISRAPKLYGDTAIIALCTRFGSEDD